MAPLSSACGSCATNLTAYDATYVALAERLDTSLITGDSQLTGASGIRCVVEVIARRRSGLGAEVAPEVGHGEGDPAALAGVDEALLEQAVAGR